MSHLCKHLPPSKHQLHGAADDLNGTTLKSAYTNMESYVQDHGTLDTAGMLHLYSLWLGRTERLFSPADSAQMQNLFDYWDGALT